MPPRVTRETFKNYKGSPSKKKKKIPRLKSTTGYSLHYIINPGYRSQKDNGRKLTPRRHIIFFGLPLEFGHTITLPEMMR